jgi:hypothetical protein
MDDKHKETLSKANKGNNHSSRANRLKNKLFKEMLQEVVSANDNEKAMSVIRALIQKAEEGDLRAIDIVLDRIDGKVPNENKIDGRVDGNFNHTLNKPMRIITGIPSDSGRDYIDWIPDPNEPNGVKTLKEEDYKRLEVTPEEARKMDEEGWEGTTLEFREPKLRDANGNIVQDDS